MKSFAGRRPGGPALSFERLCSSAELALSGDRVETVGFRSNWTDKMSRMRILDSYLCHSDVDT